MEEWKEYKLGEVVNILDSKRVPLSSKERSTRQGCYPYYGAQGIIDYIDDYLFDGTYLLIAEDGENLKSQKQNVAQLASGKYWVNNHAHILESNGESDIRYICYLLNTLDLSGYITGSAQPKLNQANLVKISIKLPPLELQKYIADYLSVIDDKIEVNRKINENLEQQAQALFKSWFVDFEPFKNGEFVESELGMIPEGWRVGTLDEIIKEAESGSRPKGGAETDGVPSIGAEKIERFGVYDYSSEKYINNNYYVQMKRGHVKEGDVLLYKDGAYTGKSSMALDGFPYKECAVNEHVFLLRTEASRFQFYLYFLISYPDIKTMIHTLASAKAAQPGLNQKELLGLDITIPNEDIIKQFNDLISPYMHQIANNAKESRRLAELRDTLLPKLMSGELKVNEIEK